MPLVGDTVNQLEAGGTTDHFNVPLPLLLIWMVLLGTLVPLLACSVSDPGLRESTGCVATGTRRNATIRKKITPSERRTEPIE